MQDSLGENGGKNGGNGLDLARFFLNIIFGQILCSSFNQFSIQKSATVSMTGFEQGPDTLCGFPQPCLEAECHLLQEFSNHLSFNNLIVFFFDMFE